MRTSTAFLIRLPNTPAGNRKYQRLLKKHKHPRIQIKPWLFKQKYLRKVYRGPRTTWSGTPAKNGHHFDVYLLEKRIYIDHKDKRKPIYDSLTRINNACQNISSQLIAIQEERHNLYKQLHNLPDFRE